MAKVPLHTSPFQLVLGRFITERASAIGIHSGRALGAVLGRSAGAVSQMLKGTLIPSGEAVLEIAEVLRLDANATEELLRSAVLSKIAMRGRDGFWLEAASLWERRAHRELREASTFLAERGLLGEFEIWRRRHASSSEIAADAPSAPSRRPHRALGGNGFAADLRDFENESNPAPMA